MHLSESFLVQSASAEAEAVADADADAEGDGEADSVGEADADGLPVGEGVADGVTGTELAPAGRKGTFGSTSSGPTFGGVAHPANTSRQPARDTASFMRATVVPTQRGRGR